MPPPVTGAAAPASALPASALPACLHPAYEVSTHGKPAGYLRASMDGATLVLDTAWRPDPVAPGA